MASQGYKQSLNNLTSISVNYITKHNRDDYNDNEPLVADNFLDNTFTGDTFVVPAPKSNEGEEEYDDEEDILNYNGADDSEEDEDDDDEDDEEVLTSDLYEEMYNVTDDPNEKMSKSLLETASKTSEDEYTNDDNEKSENTVPNSKVSKLKEYLMKVGAIDKAKRAARYTRQQGKEKLESIKRRAQSIPNKYRSIKQHLSRGAASDDEGSKPSKMNSFNKYIKDKARNLKKNVSSSYEDLKQKWE